MNETPNFPHEGKDPMNNRLDFSEAPPILEKPVQPKEKRNPTTAFSKEEEKILYNPPPSPKRITIAEAYKKLTQAANPNPKEGNQTPSYGVETEGSNAYILFY